jgi:hypothetical protein
MARTQRSVTGAESTVTGGRRSSEALDPSRVQDRRVWSRAISCRRVQGCRARSLTVAAVQPRCVAYDVAHNATAHAELVRAADARVVVFPELSLTGYELDAPGVRIDDRRLAPIVDACASTGALALVGAPIADRGEHIAMLAVDGGGAEVTYRKMWLRLRWFR